MQTEIVKHNQAVRWRRRKESRGEEILEAALAQFSEHGYARTKLDDLAKAAGISKGTLYLYFENKEAIFKSVVTHYVFPEIERAEISLLSFKGSSAELIHKLIHQWWDIVGETNLGCLPKMIISEANNFPDIAQFYVDNVIQRVRHLVIKIIKAGIDKKEFRKCDPEYVARVLISPMVFTAIWENSLVTYDSEEYDVRKFVDTHLEIFIKGILKEIK